MKQPDKDIFKLSIFDLRLWVHLGYSEEEKLHPQMISLDIDLFFNSCPKGSKTDNLVDTICYHELIKLVTSHCQNKNFNLIEHLTQSIYNKISDFLMPQKHIIDSVKIEIHKISPPVLNLHGGVSWTHHTTLGNKDK